MMTLVSFGAVYVLCSVLFASDTMGRGRAVAQICDAFILEADAG